MIEKNNNLNLLNPQQTFHIVSLSFIVRLTQNMGSLSDFHIWPAAGLRRPRPQRQGSL